ncbi:ArsR/SmtB family transcription factor [Halarchaeum sp. P4]|uniref:ArsR/SmtB family transcription factor n=1 Tax=Halarchaeum sp. P4 TaxID=3421639 RepID=UPI003EBBF309
MSSEPSQQGGGDSAAEDANTVAVLDALGDETCREILRSADGETPTVGELAATCDVSESTVYRRLSELRDLGLIEPANWPVATDGTEYRTTFDTVSVALEDGEFALSLNDADGVGSTLQSIESRVDVEYATFERETQRVELELTVDEEFFEFLTASDGF